MWHLKIPGGAIALASLLLLVTVRPSAAGSPQWWMAPAVQRELRLTKKQVAKIDRIFRTDLRERRRLAQDQEALESQLEAVLLEGTVEEPNFSDLVDKVVQAQCRRNVSRTLMILRMYRVLTTEQRSRFNHIRQDSK